LGRLEAELVAPLRTHFEQRHNTQQLRASMLDVVDVSRRRARRAMDARIARAEAALQAEAPGELSTVQAASAAGLSPSRFQHLFTHEVGVPFRRYRGWHRLRAAIREASTGSTLTASAHAAGFADQAHFTRAFRRTFGAPPSRGL
jgi:AraC-like DNA-binding protein